MLDEHAMWFHRKGLCCTGKYTCMPLCLCADGQDDDPSIHQSNPPTCFPTRPCHSNSTKLICFMIGYLSFITPWIQKATVHDRQISYIVARAAGRRPGDAIVPLGIKCNRIKVSPRCLRTYTRLVYRSACRTQY